MKFLNEISLLQVADDATSEDVLVLVDDLVKKRSMASVYLKSVTVNLPGIFNPLAATATPGSETLTFSLKSQTRYHVFAAPLVANGTPSFRALTMADISDFDIDDVNYWKKIGNDISYTGGSVSIGTTVPDAMFHVAGSGLLNSLVIGDSYAVPALFGMSNVGFSVNQGVSYFNTKTAFNSTVAIGSFSDNGFGKLQVSGSIWQNAIAGNKLVKTDANGTLVAAVDGTDYFSPSLLNGSFIQNQYSSAQSGASFWVGGNGRVGSNLTLDGQFLFQTSSLGGFQMSTNANRLFIAPRNSANTGWDYTSEFGWNGDNRNWYYESALSLGTVTAIEALTVFPSSDSSILVGRAKIGYLGYASYAGFGFYGLGTGSYALLQQSDGTTFINSAGGTPIYFRINNGTKAAFTAGGYFVINNGVSSFGSYHLQVNGHVYVHQTITQKGVLGAMVKADGLGQLVAAVDGTDYFSPSLLNGSFIQNQYSSAQSASMWISGNVKTDLVMLSSGFRNNADNINYNILTRNSSESPVLYIQNASVTGDLLHLLNGSVAANVGTSRFIVKGSGNVGIGTSTPLHALDFAIANQQTQTAKINFSPTNYTVAEAYGSGITWQVNYTGYTKRSAGILQVAEGNYFRSGLAFFVNGTANATTDWIEAMRINSIGNVGIGTTDPGTYRLRVEGTVFVGRQNNVSEGGQIGFADAYTNNQAFYIDVYGTSEATARWRFVDALYAQERISIYRSGDVSIGGTNNGWGRLQVNGAIWQSSVTGNKLLMADSNGTIVEATGSAVTGLVNGSFIQNQYSSAQSGASFWISGNMRSEGNVIVNGAGTYSDTNYIAFVAGRAYFGYDGTNQSAIMFAGSGKHIDFSMNGTISARIDSVSKYFIVNPSGSALSSMGAYSLQVYESASGSAFLRGNVVINPNAGTGLILGRTGGVANIKGNTAYGDGHIIIDPASGSNLVALSYYNSGLTILGYGGGNVLIGTNDNTSGHRLRVNGSIGQNQFFDTLVRVDSTGKFTSAVASDVNSLVGASMSTHYIPKWNGTSFVNSPIYNPDSYTIRLRGLGTGVGNASWIGFYESNLSTRNGYIGFGSTTNNAMYIYTDAGMDGIYFYGGGGFAGSINSLGYWGLGYNTVTGSVGSYKLQVSGSVYINGTVRQSNAYSALVYANGSGDLTAANSSHVIATLGYTPVPTSRTITINGNTQDFSTNVSYTISTSSNLWSVSGANIYRNSKVSINNTGVINSGDSNIVGAALQVNGGIVAYNSASGNDALLINQFGVQIKTSASAYGAGMLLDKASSTLKISNAGYHVSINEGSGTGGACIKVNTGVIFMGEDSQKGLIGTGGYKVVIAALATDDNALYVRGAIHTTDTMSFGSDRKLKDQVKPIENALESLKQIGGYRYLFRGKKIAYGFIAQDVERYYPEMVSEGPGYKVLDYNGMIAVTAKAVVELSRQVDSNTQGIKELKAENSKQKKVIAELRAIIEKYGLNA